MFPPPLTLTKAPLVLGIASALCGSDAKDGPPWQGAPCEGQGCYKEGTETSDFTQSQGSSDQILAGKTDENEISFYYIIFILHLSVNGGVSVCGTCTSACFAPQRLQPGSFAG